jgi:pseudouridine kinase
MSENEKKILELIRDNPFISQEELSKWIGISRSSVAGYISSLMKKGEIIGRAYMLPNEHHITCIGGANVDRKVQTFNPIRYQTSNPAFSTISSGGVARNVAENLGRLSCSTSLLTCVGDDKEGDWLLEETRHHQVDTHPSFVVPSERTGTYTAILNSSGEMELALADMQIYEQIEPSLLNKRWSFVSSSQMVFLDTNFPEATLSYLIERCKKEGIPLCINPVSAPKAKKLPKDLHGVNLIIPNKDEAEVLSGVRIGQQADYLRAGERILEKGVNQVIITLGEDGVFWATNSGMSEHILPFPVQTVDVTGAGDSLIAGVLFGLSQGESLSTSCRLGLASASYTIQTKETVYPHLSSTLLYEKIANAD